MNTIWRGIPLQEGDFAQLVRGAVVQVKGPAGNVIAEICLADIGWDRMYFHLELAMRDAGVTEI